MAKMYDFPCKLLLIGDDSVGKTSILKRFVEGSFTFYTIATIGM